MQTNLPAGPDAITRAPARSHVQTPGTGRPPLSRAERRGVLAGALAMAGSGAYGVATGSPSTVGYLLSVLVIGAAVAWLRRSPLPGLLVTGLAVAAVVNLAGGLINVGHDVLYNAHAGPYSRSLGTHFLQYDHAGHAYASFVIAFACWVMLAAPHAAGGHRRELVILSVGTALGLGAVNEVVEFLATLAHHGAHAGGYWNTGWDLVCNLIGAVVAGIVIARSTTGAA